MNNRLILSVLVTYYRMLMTPLNLIVSSFPNLQNRVNNFNLFFRDRSRLSIITIN